MNNKGQTLVIFVLILPIIILGIGFIFIYTYSNYEKNNQKNIINILCKQYKKDNNIDEIIKLGNANDKTQEIKIKRIDDSIKITLTKKTIFNIKIKTDTIC